MALPCGGTRNGMVIVDQHAAQALGSGLGTLIYSGTAEMVFAPLVTGEVGILPRHAPLLARMKPGALFVNISRAELVAEGALLRARVQGWDEAVYIYPEHAALAASVALIAFALF
mgnify:CR=1 FL=1